MAYQNIEQDDHDLDWRSDSAGSFRTISNICGTRPASPDSSEHQETHFSDGDRIKIRGNRPRGKQPQKITTHSRYGTTRPIPGNPSSTTVGGIHVVGTGKQDRVVESRLDDRGNSKRGKIRHILYFCKLFSGLILLCILSISGVFIYDHRPGGVADINTLTSPSNMGALTLPTNSTYNFTIPNSERYSYVNYSLDLTAYDNSEVVRVDFTLCDPYSNNKEPVGQYFRLEHLCELSDEKEMDISNTIKDCSIIRYWPEVNSDLISGYVSCWTTESDNDDHKVYLVWDFLFLNETNIIKLSDLINCADAIHKYPDVDREWHQCNKTESPLDISSTIFEQRTQDKNVFVMRFCLGKGAALATTDFTVDFHEYFYNYFTEPGINLYSIDTNKGKTSVLVPLVSDEGTQGDDISVCIKVTSINTAQPVVINRYGIPSMQYVHKQTVSNKDIIDVFDGAIAILEVTVILFFLLCFIYRY